MTVHIFSPSTGVAGGRGKWSSVNLRTARATQTLFSKRKERKRKEKELVKKSFLLLCVCLECSWKLEEDIRSPGAGITGSYGC